MMMTLGTAATRISSTSKCSGAGEWRWAGGAGVCWTVPILHPSTSQWWVMARHVAEFFLQRTAESWVSVQVRKSDFRPRRRQKLRVKRGSDLRMSELKGFSWLDGNAKAVSLRWCEMTDSLSVTQYLFWLYSIKMDLKWRRNSCFCFFFYN